MEKTIKKLQSIDLNTHIHAANFLAKYKRYDDLSKAQQNALEKLVEKYLLFLNTNIKLIGYSHSIIEKRTKSLNEYFDFISSNNFDNIFSAQSKFRPTIMEEFMFYLFRDLILEIKKNINDNSNQLKLGGAKAYTNLYFSAKNLESFIQEPKIGVNQKDQDFAIYRPISLIIEGTTNIHANLPVVAIENKTFIDKTMLEGSIATAEKIKSGNPYSLYFIVTETYEVDLNVDPAYSRINQIYVLRKCKKRDAANPIYSDVLCDLLDNIKNHLERDWSNIESKLTQHGRII